MTKRRFVADDDSNNTSVWTYTVEELEDAQDLSNWVLELPECLTLTDASIGYEIVDDPNANLYGIKWETKTDFQTGEFTMTFEGNVIADVVQVAAKGPDVVVGKIVGPVCQE